MIAEQGCSEPDSYHEPDSEDFARMIAQEKEVTSLHSGYHEADKELHNYQKHTDRQLRALSKEKKDCARHLRWSHHFDVISDSFEVQVGEDASDSVPWPYYEDEDVIDNATRVLTRKDKRRARTKQRKAAKYLRIRRTQCEKSRAASLVGKTRALVPAVAA